MLHLRLLLQLLWGLVQLAGTPVVLIGPLLRNSGNRVSSAKFDQLDATSPAEARYMIDFSVFNG